MRADFGCILSEFDQGYLPGNPLIPLIGKITLDNRLDIGQYGRELGETNGYISSIP